MYNVYNVSVGESLGKRHWTTNCCCCCLVRCPVSATAHYRRWCVCMHARPSTLAAAAVWKKHRLLYGALKWKVAMSGVRFSGYHWMNSTATAAVSMAIHSLMPYSPGECVPLPLFGECVCVCVCVPLSEYAVSSSSSSPFDFICAPYDRSMGWCCCCGWRGRGQLLCRCLVCVCSLWWYGVFNDCQFVWLCAR